MEIGEAQTEVRIVVKSKKVGLPANVEFTASLLSCHYEDETDGILLVE